MDRPIDIAITEFAPGSERTKKKSILKSIGFTQPIGKAEWSKNWATFSDKDPIPFRMYMDRCKECGRVVVKKEPTGNEECSYCGTPKGEKFRSSMPVGTPAGFRTDFTWGKDSQDTDVYYGMVPIIADIKRPNYRKNGHFNCETDFQSGQRVWRINDNFGKMFKGCLVTTTGFRTPTKFVKFHSLKKQWIADDYLDSVVETVPQDIVHEEIALIAGKYTDVFKYRPHSVPEGLCLDPFLNQSSIKGAIYSAAFLVRFAVAEILDIDPQEIEISSITRGKIGIKNIAETAFCDELPNGSGFVEWISIKWESILNSFLNTPTKGSFPDLLYSSAHREECATACYKCLMSYYNMSYHGLLDWRLGIAYLRAIRDSAFNCGLDNNFSYPELKGWLELSNTLASDFSGSFKWEFHNKSSLPWVKKEKKAAIIIHPLWDIASPKGILAETLAEIDMESCQFIDAFNLLRRPSYCHSILWQGS